MIYILKREEVIVKTKDIYKQIGIYRITNKVNGKSYIGKTGMNFGDRWDNHRSLLRCGKHSNQHLQNAWNKYGEGSFEFAIVEIVNDVDVLNDLERYYIAEYRKNNLCYNINDGGDGGTFLGHHLSSETKRKIGEKNRAHMIGRKASAETRAKMSASQRKRYSEWTDADRKAYGEWVSKVASGYKYSDEARAAVILREHTHPNAAKLTPESVKEIREKSAAGVGRLQLAKEYNTSPSNISQIVHYKRWAYI